jgi:hypothetical protein
VEVLGLGEHYRRAEIDARLVGEDGSVVVERDPTNVTRFALSPPALRTLNSTLTIVGRKIDLPRHTPGESAVIERTSTGWRYQGPREDIVPKLAGKRPGLQGPIDDAFATRFLCIRGTGKPWNPAAGAWADANLARFADEWRRHYRGYLPIKNDVDVTRDDVRQCNLILFGDPGSNRYINNVLPHLPIRWTKEDLEISGTKYGAVDHAPELIYPSPLAGAAGRYVVLNSGHTYHDYELQLSYMVFPRLGDWAVMKFADKQPATSPTSRRAVSESVTTSGFFDEEWKNPREP